MYVASVVILKLLTMFSKKHSCKIFLTSNNFTIKKNVSQLCKPSLPILKVVSCNGKKLVQNEKFTNCLLFTFSKRYVSNKNNIVESKYGPITLPNSNLPQYVWRDVAKWADKPMIVSRAYITFVDNYTFYTYVNIPINCWYVERLYET